MAIKTEQAKLWSFDELNRIYSNIQDELIGERLKKALEFAERRNAMMVSKNYYPSFGLRGKCGKRIISFWSPEIHHGKIPGSIHLFVSLKRYCSSEERNRLVEKLNEMLAFGYDLNDIFRCRTSNKSLRDLSEKDFSAFMDVLEEYSK